MIYDDVEMTKRDKDGKKTKDTGLNSDSNATIELRFRWGRKRSLFCFRADELWRESLSVTSQFLLSMQQISRLPNVAVGRADECRQNSARITLILLDY